MVDTTHLQLPPDFPLTLQQVAGLTDSTPDKIRRLGLAGAFKIHQDGGRGKITMRFDQLDRVKAALAEPKGAKQTVADQIADLQLRVTALERGMVTIGGTPPVKESQRNYPNTPEEAFVSPDDVKPLSDDEQATILQEQLEAADAIPF